MPRHTQCPQHLRGPGDITFRPGPRRMNSALAQAKPTKVGWLTQVRGIYQPALAGFALGSTEFIRWPLAQSRPKRSVNT